MSSSEFSVAGAELAWPIGSAAGMTNHPDINVVANRIENLTTSGLSFIVAGSWTLGEARSGNAYVKNDDGTWEYLGGDEYVNLELLAGYNAKGLPGPGTDVGMDSLDDLLDITRSRNVELALSLSPHSGQPLEELKELVERGRVALSKGVLYVEFNLSCPNVPDRPPFYKDADSVIRFYEYLASIDPLVNKNGYPGAYPKYGPFEIGELPPVVKYCSSVGGRVISNTLGNQVPLTSSGDQAVRVNNGKAGMSGPALKKLGREQLDLHMGTSEAGEIISVLGVESGEEVKIRLNMGAAAVQLGSVIYWPELVGCETAEEVVEQIKQEFVEVAA